VPVVSANTSIAAVIDALGHGLSTGYTRTTFTRLLMEARGSISRMANVCAHRITNSRQLRLGFNDFSDERDEVMKMPKSLISLGGTFRIPSFAPQQAPCLSRADFFVRRVIFQTGAVRPRQI
jgi:hypothetical protein